jgi:hypothetical protein
MRMLRVQRVDRPLVVISQAQRSGGTLMSQIFDGHPECHVEEIGHPSCVFARGPAPLAKRL